MFLSALWLLISFYKSKGNIINCHESWKKFVLFPTKMKIVVNIDLSQQAISKFPLSEVKINFIQNFEIFETYCILEYDKTLLY